MSSLKAELFSLLRQTSLASDCYLIGGSLRDEILGIESLDFDFCVEKENGAEEITKELHHRFPNEFSTPYHMGKNYPIWQVTWKGLDIQFADTHREDYPNSQSRQRVLRFASKEEDCKRRDFTINMLYQRVSNDETLDLCGQSIDDIKQRRLKPHPDVPAEEMFFEDPLRILRFFRFEAKYSLFSSPEFRAALRSQRERLKIVSPERVRDEIIKICEHGSFHRCLESMRELGVLELLFPEALPMIGCEQDRRFHSEGDVWTHTLLVLKNAPNTLPLQLAAFFHDIGKPITQSVENDRIRFIDHEKHSAKICRVVMERLKFSKKQTDTVEKLVALHMRGGDVESWKGSRAARKYLRDSNGVTDELLQLYEADSKSSIAQDGSLPLKRIETLKKKVKEASQIPLVRKALLDGDTLMHELSIEAGPILGVIQKRLIEEEDDAKSQGRPFEKKHALELAREILKHASK